MSQSSLDPAWRHKNSTTEVDGFHVPVEVRTSPGKGRGVFLTSAVSKGQVIWDNRYTARFPDECSVRQFLAAISEETACEVIMWAYVNDFFSGQALEFQVDLDGAAYFNEAPDIAQTNFVTRFPENLSFDAQNTETVATIVAERRVPGSMRAYAKSDLKAGTELMFDYADVHIYAKLFWFEKLCFMTRGLWAWLVMQ